MFPESEEGALAAVRPAAPLPGSAAPPGDAGARESRRVYVSGERCLRPGAGTWRIPAGNTGQAVRQELN